jgi:hypothetical protein
MFAYVKSKRLVEVLEGGTSVRRRQRNVANKAIEILALTVNPMLISINK